MAMSIEKIPNWLRWSLTPIASLVTFALALVISSILAKIFTFIGGERGLSENFLQYLIVPGFASYCAVLAPAILAPAGHQRVAVACAAIWIFMWGVGVVFVLVGAEYKNLLPLIAMTVGSIIGALSHEVAT